MWQGNECGLRGLWPHVDRCFCQQIFETAAGVCDDQRFVFFTGSLVISSQVCDDCNRNFKPNHNVFFTLTKWLVWLNLTRAYAQHRDREEIENVTKRSFNFSVVLQKCTIDDSKHITSVFGSLYSRLTDLAGKRINTNVYGPQQQQNKVQHLTPSQINIQSRYKKTNEAPVIIYYGGGKQLFCFSVSISFHYSFSKHIVHVQRICRVTETQTGAVRMEAESV